MGIRREDRVVFTSVIVLVFIAGLFLVCLPLLLLSPPPPLLLYRMIVLHFRDALNVQDFRLVLFTPREGGTSEWNKNKYRMNLIKPYVEDMNFKSENSYG